MQFVHTTSLNYFITECWESFNMRNIGILRDGYSDYLVIKKFVSTLLVKHRAENPSNNDFLDLESLNITNALAKYVDRISKSGNYSYQSAEAQELVRQLTGVYLGCYNRLQSEYEYISNKTVIVVSTDAEKILGSRINYFTEWAYNVKGVLYFSIERFYEQMVSMGYDYETLPYYIPLVPFPSSEILVASCMFNITAENLRNLRPNPALKLKVYSTASIPEALGNGILHDVLEKYLVESNIKEIYKEIPEARMLIHSLSS